MLQKMLTCGFVGLVCVVASTVALGAAASRFVAEPLAPAAFEPLPAGTIHPEGWLGRNLDMQADGLIGRLYETSPYLCSSNQWLNHISGTRYCWEEGPCWARTFVKLAVLTQNPRLLKEAEKWMRAQADQQLEDGWYGRDAGVRKSQNGPEIFTHIIMNEAVLTWYEYTKDVRYLDLLRRFIDCLDDMPETAIMSYNNKVAPPVFKQLAYHDECFAATNAACEIVVRGKRAPEWKLNCNQPGDIPFMPVAGDGAEVDLRFVPMACQRCHVTVFPQLAAPGQALAVHPPNAGLDDVKH